MKIFQPLSGKQVQEDPLPEITWNSSEAFRSCEITPTKKVMQKKFESDIIPIRHSLNTRNQSVRSEKTNLWMKSKQMSGYRKRLIPNLSVRKRYLYYDKIENYNKK